MNPFGNVLFKAPKRSVFEGQSSHKLSYEIGKIIPLKYYDLAPGDRLSLNLSQLTRFAPLLAPVMQNFKLYVDAVACPYRLLYHPLNGNPVTAFNAEKFFNLQVPAASRPAMPAVDVSTLLSQSILECWQGSPDKARTTNIGSLFDYLGYPLFSQYLANFRLALSDYLQSTFFYYANVDSYVLNPVYTLADGYDDISLEIGPVNEPAQNSVKFKSLPSFISSTYNHGRVLPGTTPSTGATEKQIPLDSILSFLNSKGLDFATVTSQYVNAFFAYFVSHLPEVSPTFLLSTQTYSLLPYYVYRRIIADWYVNPNMEDLSAYCARYLSSNVTVPSSKSDVSAHIYNSLADAYYSNDYFTSAFTSPQSGSTVKIPVNGSISDLRSAGKLQQLMEKVLYAGSRLLDQNMAIFGVKSRNQEPDRCQVLARKTFDIQISDISQTSQSDINSNLGDYAGQGFSYANQQSFVDFTADEHTMVMLLISLRPQATYQDQVNRLLYKSSPYDFLQPDMANIGEQTVLSDELSPSLSDDNTGSTFGFQRRYAEYMYEPSTVNGEFRSSLDYWTASRQFDPTSNNAFAVNADFCKITDSDNYNRIFAISGASEHIYSYFGINYKVSRALPRYVNYSL